VNFLIDTHILLWWLHDDKHLSLKARKLISQLSNSIFVSAVSAWEISIKKSLHKLIAPDNLTQAILHSGFQLLPIDFNHAEFVGSLPNYHNDPFDRMLVAQAKIENLHLMTHDKRLVQYNILISLV
jgi:PIN domain nuclease of toxin-antitoxin system